MAYALKQSRMNFLHIANPDLRNALSQGMAMFYLQDLAAAAVGILAAKAGNSATMSWTSAITSPEHPRSVQVVFAGGYDGGDITLTGIDQFGRAQTEVIADNAGATVQGVKVWKTITTVAKELVGINAATFTLQTGTDKLGLPAPVLGAWGLMFVDGVAELASFDTTANSFLPGTSAPNGAHDYLLLVPVDWAKYEGMVVIEQRDI